MSIALLNGQPATADDLRRLAVINYGHFTAMQVRAHAVQGLELHIERLQIGTRELFDAELPRERILDALAGARLGPPDSSLRMTVFSRDFDYRDPMRVVSPDLLLTLAPPTPSAKPAMRVKSYPFVRTLPAVKHVGTFPLFHYRRQARRDGFDDALFVTDAGQVVEGSIWNIGFWDGQRVIWPEGPALRGTHEALLEAGLAAQGMDQVRRPVFLHEIPTFACAFAANASGLQEIGGIDDFRFAGADALMSRLAVCLECSPWIPLPG